MKQMGKSYLFIFLALVLGVLSGAWNHPMVMKGAEVVSTLFMNFLQLIAAPIVFLAIFSTLLGMRGFGEMRTLGKRVFIYTVLTSVIAASIALALFLVVDPTRGVLADTPLGDGGAIPGSSYVYFVVKSVPSNLVQPFLENNVIGIALISFLLGIAALKLPEENRQSLNLFFSSIFKLILKVTEYIILLMPFGIWAFVTQLTYELKSSGGQFKSVLLFLVVVLGANLIQGVVVLPLLLKVKGLSPLKIAKGASKALLLAFFTKSSNATLPATLESAENRLGISSKVANFSLPLCTVINMNGCAAFILTTVLFVSKMNGLTFAPWALALWVGLATLAAIGNAGVPMGCFFLSSAFLVALDVPITLMGIILPFYAFIDMLETALNVWSDISVTALVDHELKQASPLEKPETLC